MSEQVNVVRVFIASPGGLDAERRLFRKVVESFNAVRARSDRYLFEPYDWHDTLQGVGRPQALINEDITKADILVMLLWNRWGSSPGDDRYTAATEEEFYLAYDLYQRRGRPHILLYFRAVPPAQLADPGPQLRKVNEFKQRIDVEKRLLYGTYERPKLLEGMLLKDLTRWLDRQVHGPGYGTAAPDGGGGAALASEISGMKAELQKLQREIREAGDALRTKESKLRAAAVGLAVEATRLLARGRLTEAERKFAQSVELYEEPEVLLNYGLFLYRRGSLERARETFERVRALPPTPEADPHRAVACQRLGNISLTWGRLDDAERMFEESLGVARRVKRRDLMADSQGALGNLYLARDEIERAEKAFARALKMSESVGDLDGCRKAHGSLGNVYVEQSRLPAARGAFRKALELAEELGNREGMESAWIGLGIVSEQQKRFAEAEGAYKRGLKLARSLGHKAGVELACGNLGNLYAAREDFAKAERMYETALEMAREVGHKDGMALTHVNLAGLRERRGDAEGARAQLGRALELYQQLGNKKEIRKLAARLDPKPAEPKKARPARAAGAAKRPAKARARTARRPYRPTTSRR